ncbi:mucin-2-like [Carassius carassius]|uniref:mucin-2-like n=1 Tax=Carassius carassius TaxID=217509 RepID=UPI00286908F8|nr:mucin-2-like [Carassius carassius]
MCDIPISDFNIQMQRETVNGSITFNTVTIELEGTIIKITNGDITMGNEKVSVPINMHGIQIEGSSTSLKISNKHGVTVFWEEDNYLTIELPEKYQGLTCGLCGNFNGNKHDDITVSGPAKWKVSTPMTETCEEVTLPPRDQCDQTSVCQQYLSSPGFADCYNVMDMSSFEKACEDDLCQCYGNYDCLCNTLTEISRQCTHAGGNPGTWRTEQLCPKTCPLNLQYMECGSPCKNTCSDPTTSLLCKEHCVDGCFCPIGTVEDDIGQSGCVNVNECPCEHNGALYQSGESYKQACKKCVCAAGHWNCTYLECPGICSVVGGSHVTTYDGKTFTFSGNCDYILTKYSNDSDIAVVGNLAKCDPARKDTCLNSITLVISGTTITFSSGGSVTVNKISPHMLPFTTGPVSIFQPSSSFIIADMKSLRLEIQLAPVMQLYIVASTEEKGKMSGLCGNYNDIQSDDFKTTLGIIEGTPTSFVNFWKQNCQDLEITFDNPCSLNIETEQLAKDWCSRLTNPNGSFAACHSEICPEMYYQWCVYDTCKCADIKKCMCAAVSNYAHVCAARGIILQGWMDSEPCDMISECSGNMKYSYGVTSCGSTCHSLSEQDNTCQGSFTPVDGCTCSEGTYLNEDGSCVHADQCPCYYGNQVIAPSAVFYKDGAKCTCDLGKLHCSSQEDCVAPMTLFKCSNHGEKGTECQRTCEKQDPNNCVSMGCISGCMCPDDLLADGKGGCVKREKCPCTHNGVLYSPGEQVQQDCNTCTCTNGMWTCTNKACYGTCTIYGEGHFRTFDGRRYSFHGDCEHTIAQDYCDTNPSPSFHLVTENIPCATTSSICSKSINLFFGKYEMILSEEEDVKVIESIGTEYRYQISSAGIYVVIEVEGLLNLIWDKKTSVMIQINNELKGKVCGLCGNFDGNANNDFMKHNGEVVTDPDDFGNSWKVKPSCPDVTNVMHPCDANPHRRAWAIKQCRIITSPVFADCHSLVDSGPYYDACERDTCACDSGGDCDCLCTAVAAYAAECRKRGACVAWRRPNFCPLFCDYYNKPPEECEWHYKPCGSTCMKTCKNPSGTCSDQIPPLEGCFPQCPSERPYLREETMKCVTEEECKDCVYNGKVFPRGSVIYETTDGNGVCFTALCDYNGEIKRIITESCGTTTSTPFTFTTTPVTTITPTITFTPTTTTTGTSTPTSIETSPTTVTIPTTSTETPSTITFTTTPTTGTTTPTTVTITPTLTETPSTVSTTTSTTTTPTSTPTSTETSPTTVTITPTSTGTPSTITSTPTPTTGSSTPMSTEKSTISTVTPSTISTTTATTTTTPICTPKCTWSDWTDGNTPSTEPEGFETEPIDALWNSKKIACQSPEEIECRAVNYPQKSLQDLGQTVYCNTSFGLSCSNEDNANSIPPLCYNYEIRVKCCKPEDYCTPSTTSPSTLTSTTSTTTVTSTPTTVTITPTSTETPSTISTTTVTTTTPTSTPTPTETSSTTYNCCYNYKSHINTYIDRNIPNNCNNNTYINRNTIHNHIHYYTDYWNIGTYVNRNITYINNWTDGNTPSTEPEGFETEPIDALWNSKKIACQSPEEIECRAYNCCYNYKSHINTYIDRNIPNNCNNNTYINRNTIHNHIHYYTDYWNIGTYVNRNITYINNWTDGNTPSTEPEGFETEPIDALWNSKKIACQSPEEIECRAYNYCYNNNSHINRNIRDNCYNNTYINRNTIHNHIDYYTNYWNIGTYYNCCYNYKSHINTYIDRNIPNNCNNNTYINRNTIHNHIHYYTDYWNIGTYYNYCYNNNSHINRNIRDNCYNNTYINRNTIHNHIDYYTDYWNIGTYFNCCYNYKSHINTYIDRNILNNCNNNTYINRNTIHNHIHYYTDYWNIGTYVNRNITYINNWTDGNTPSTEPEGFETEPIDALWNAKKIACQSPEEIECRAVNYPQKSLQDLGQTVYCNTSFGLSCSNEDNANSIPPLCYNYEIRVKCCKPEDYCTPSTTSPSTLTSTTSTTTATSTPTTVTITPTSTETPSTISTTTATTTTLTSTPTSTETSPTTVTITPTSTETPSTISTTTVTTTTPTSTPTSTETSPTTVTITPTSTETPSTISTTTATTTTPISTPTSTETSPTTYNCCYNYKSHINTYIDRNIPNNCNNNTYINRNTIHNHIHYYTDYWNIGTYYNYCYNNNSNINTYINRNIPDNCYNNTYINRNTIHNQIHYYTNYWNIDTYINRNITNINNWTDGNTPSTEPEGFETEPIDALWNSKKIACQSPEEIECRAYNYCYNNNSNINTYINRNIPDNCYNNTYINRNTIHNQIHYYTNYWNIDTYINRNITNINSNTIYN